MWSRLLSISCVAVMLLWPCREGNGAALLRIQHPDDRSKQVEYFVEQPPGTGPWPTIVLLHGHQNEPRPGGKSFVDWGVLKQFAGRGYLAVAVSQPGYGGSTGPPDFCGPLTQHAVAAVIAKLRAEGQVARGKLLIEGVSRGAVTAGLLAAQDPSVAGLVLISGVYDFTAYVKEPDQSPEKRSIVRAILEETGGTNSALESRSVLGLAGRIKASTLVLNGARDDRTSPEQAGRLTDKIVGSGGKARAILYPEYGHNIPVDVRSKDVDPFIDGILAPRLQ